MPAQENVGITPADETLGVTIPGMGTRCVTRGETLIPHLGMEYYD